MDNLLYFDTARIGRPTPTTVQAATDSVRFAAEEGGTAYFDRFLREGFANCPRELSAKYPGLHAWQGIASLKSDLRSLVGGTPELPVLIANRTAQLMGFAARLFFPKCRNVLTCDLGWPAYLSILQSKAADAQSQVTVVPLRDMIFENHVTADEIVELMAREYRSRDCDAIFLPAVSNLGVRLPVEQIVKRIERSGELRLVIVDGAQEFCHTPLQLAHDYCDMYLAGCHKWLAGHHPMGVAFYGRPRSRGMIGRLLARLLTAGVVDDPLLRYSEADGFQHSDNYSETVSLAGLFTCQAAVKQATAASHSDRGFQVRLENRRLLQEVLPQTGWQPMHIDGTMESAILLAKPERKTDRVIEPTELREAFRRRGIGLTAYPNRVVRLAMPSVPIQPCIDVGKFYDCFVSMAN